MNKRTWSILVFAFGLGITMFIPLATMADYIDANGVLHKGLVACDPSIPIGNPDSCDMCALLKTIQVVFEWVMGAIFVVATGILVYNGVLFYFSQGQPANVNKIIGNIKNVVIGIIIVMASFIIINTILNWFAAPGSIPTFWNNIECVPGEGGGGGPTPTPTLTQYACASQDVAVCIPNASSICTSGGTHARYTCSGGTPQLDACCTSLAWGYACDICINTPGNPTPLPPMEGDDECVEGTQKITNDPCWPTNIRTTYRCVDGHWEFLHCVV